MGLNEIKKLLQAKETTEKQRNSLQIGRKLLQSNDIIKDLEYTLQQLQNVYFVHRELSLE